MSLAASSAPTGRWRRLVLPRLVRPQARDPHLDWRGRLGRVVATSFQRIGVDEDAQRLRQAVGEILASPYEHLCRLRAQELVTAEERVLIQRESTRAGDQPLYGPISAITSIAHQHRSEGEWRAAMMMERLGGEIMRGDTCRRRSRRPAAAEASSGIRGSPQRRPGA